MLRTTFGHLEGQPCPSCPHLTRCRPLREGQLRSVALDHKSACVYLRLHIASLGTTASTSHWCYHCAGSQLFAGCTHAVPVRYWMFHILLLPVEACIVLRQWYST